MQATTQGGATATTWAHLFTRDFRIVDHSALHALRGERILPLFVFTPEQTTENDLFNKASFGFLCDSLRELASDIAQQGGRLYVFRDDTIDVLQRLARTTPLAGVSITADYTPYAKARQRRIEQFCKRQGIAFQATHDIYMHAPGSVTNKAGKTFQKFTPYYEAARRRDVPKPREHERYTWARPALTGTVTIPKINVVTHAQGGRSAALHILRTYDYDRYDETHDFLNEKTTGLSAHNHYGTVSIREVYWAFPNEALRRQLHWRDFYGAIMDAFDELYGTDAYDFMKEPGRGWRTDRAEFNKWAEGRTGVPLVDDSMKQLLETGYMHNRARLVVASYLVKDLKIHWRWGERHFAKHLVDYDFTQNFCNWCWVSSVLPFAMPPFRRFDPEAQLKRYGSTASSQS